MGRVATLGSHLGRKTCPTDHQPSRQLQPAMDCARAPARRTRPPPGGSDLAADEGLPYGTYPRSRVQPRPREKQSDDPALRSQHHRTVVPAGWRREDRSHLRREPEAIPAGDEGRPRPAGRPPGSHAIRDAARRGHRGPVVTSQRGRRRRRRGGAAEVALGGDQRVRRQARGAGATATSRWACQRPRNCLRSWA